MRYQAFFVALALFSNQIYGNDDEIVKKVNAALLIRDPRTALDIIRNYQINHPNSKVLQETLIKALAKNGDEHGMLAAWDTYTELNTEAWSNVNLLEAMAWGVIDKASNSEMPLTRALSLVACCLSNTIEGVNILHHHLSDRNALLRAVSVELASKYKDMKLQKQILKLLREETNYIVRLQAIMASGRMKIEEAKPILEDIIANDYATDEEKALCIESLVNMLESATREEVQGLVTSDRMGLRLLACEVVAALDLLRDVDLLLPLVSDSSPDVRTVAILVLGIIGADTYNDKPIVEYIRPRLKDNDYHVRAVAAWWLTVNGSKEGYATFHDGLAKESQEERLFTAATLAATGEKGLPLMKKYAFSHHDPYVRMNLAIGLIGMRDSTNRAANELYQGLTTINERWNWEKMTIMRVLEPSKVKHKDEMPQYPETVNQTVRLEILSLLATLHYPQAQDALKKFLKERVLSLTGITVAVMIKEGDQDALELASTLLKDPDPKVSVQAALILALWGRDEKVITQLEEAYPASDREMKEKILEGLGKIGATNSIPFLVKCLAEPQQNLRVIAASALLLCLNH
jgi:HEAT repeat protein